MLVLIALLSALVQQAPQNGSIEGTVMRSGTKFPLAGVQIKTAIGEPFVAETVTDGTGYFILRDIPPGRVQLHASLDGYILGNSPNPFFRFPVTVAPGQKVQLPPLTGVPAAAIRGRVLDNEGKGIPGVALAFVRPFTDAQGLQLVPMQGAVQTDDQGEYRKEMLNPGTYYVRAAVDRPGAPRMLVYHPSATDVGTAALVVLGEGSEVTADIHVTDRLNENTYKISGRVLPLPGQSATPSTVLILIPRDPRQSSGVDKFAVVDPFSSEEATGKFELRGIRPGSYDLLASVNIDGKEYMAKVSTGVDTRDIEDLEITLLPALEIKGRLVTDADSPDLRLGRSGRGSLRVGLSRKDNLFAGNLLEPVIDETGTAFTFAQVPQGDYDVAVSFLASTGSPPNPDLFVADVRVSGRSVLDNGLQVGIDPVDNLEVVIGSNGGAISGTIPGVTPNKPAILVLMPELNRRSNPSLSRSLINSSPNGEFQLRGLTPGNYILFAVPYAAGLAYLNPDLVARYEQHAVVAVVRKGIPVNGLQVPLLSPGR